MSLFRSSNIFKKKSSPIQIFPLPVKLTMRAHLEAFFGLMEEQFSLSFCDVIVFDTTYRSNHLNLPFAPFTRVNHHRQFILFDYALFVDEQRDTFFWLFNKWLKCMHGVTPKVIITDQDAQIGDAIKIIFPNPSIVTVFGI